MRKLFASLLPLALALSACTPGSRPGMSGSAAPNAPTATAPSQTTSTTREGGGVDVGNMRSFADIPHTGASIGFPSSWVSNVSGAVLTLQNTTGSKVEARRSTITELASPSAVALTKYLKEKFPERTYEPIQLQGLSGLRANIVDTKETKTAELYLWSESKDFIQIEATLQGAGIKEGEAILSTVRVKYKGVAYPNSAPHTVTLTGAYSFACDCSDANTVRMQPSHYRAQHSLEIGLAGAHTGRIVELGTEADVPFSEVRVEGDELVAPKTTTPLLDVYRSFSPGDQIHQQSRLALKEGHVYLVRTIDWPNEDLLTKMRVDKLGDDDSMTITYQKLSEIPKKELEKEVERANEYTRTVEMPRETGEVTLFSRHEYDSYNYASFNFEFSNSGNSFMSGNSWNLLFGNGPGSIDLSVPHVSGELGEVVDVGDRPLSTLTLNDFPDPNGFRRGQSVKAMVGHTYLVWHFKYSREETAAVYGAVQVVDLDPKARWVRLRFRRIKLAPLTHFQHWTPLKIPHGIETLSVENSPKNRGLEFMSESVYLGWRGQGQDYLGTDSRPFVGTRGFVKLPQGTTLEAPTLEQLEKLSGQYDNRVAIQAGDVIAVRLENFYDLTVLVLRVDELRTGESAKLSLRTLLRAKAPYSEIRD